MREQTQVNQVLKIIEGFDFKIPLHHFIKNHFRVNKQLGSRDRRLISSFVYNYFRLGKGFDEISTEQKIFFSNYILGEWNEMMRFLNDTFVFSSLSASEKSKRNKIEDVKNATSFSLEKIFPFKAELSYGIDYEKFLLSFLEQPLVWIRIRKEYREKVIEELNKNEIHFTGDVSYSTPSVRGWGRALGFKNSTKLSQLKSFDNGHFEIQDLSSQKTIAFFPQVKNDQWWDCCAGAGGKSLMLADAFPEIELLLSDIRQTILENSKERLKKAGVKNFKLEVCDLTTTNFKFQTPNILCDVPCSGSGTWARSPEYLWNYSSDKMEDFYSLQKSILKNICKKVEPGGHLVYITCSVFRNENENNVEFMTNNFSFKLIKQQIIEGYNCGADTMFIANLIKEK
jgi:16S rRNA (cytosine967-C5)-methyltransferase